MFKKLAFLAILVIVVAVAYGAAADLKVEGGAIQAGSDYTLKCDPDGVTTGWGLEIDTNTVNDVKIKGVDALCAGSVLGVEVLGPSGRLFIAHQTAVTGQNQFTFTMPLDPHEITGLRVWIEGDNGL